jgi:hypothetical protein
LGGALPQAGSKGMVLITGDCDDQGGASYQIGSPKNFNQISELKGHRNDSGV